MSESNFPDSETTNADFSELHNKPTKDEIEKYRASVALRILRNSTELIENHGTDYARSVISELILSAEQYICIYCEKLSEIIYKPLLFHFLLAFAQGVKIRIITQKSPQDSETSRFLAKKSIIKTAKEDIGHEHFILIDGIRYRQEKDAVKKNAIVCPMVSKNVFYSGKESSDKKSTFDIANNLLSFFNKEWEQADFAKISD